MSHDDNWSRYLSLYQLGLGSRGIGFRDSSQDVMATVLHMPEEGRALIEKLLSVQRRNGSAMHQFYPLTMEGSEGDSRESPTGPFYYSDDHLWMILAVCAYLKASGDFAFLDKTLPYYEKVPTARQKRAARSWITCCAALSLHMAIPGRMGCRCWAMPIGTIQSTCGSGAELFFTASLYGKALLD